VSISATTSVGSIPAAEAGTGFRRPRADDLLSGTAPRGCMTAMNVPTTVVPTSERRPLRALSGFAAGLLLSLLIAACGGQDEPAGTTGSNGASGTPATANQTKPSAPPVDPAPSSPAQVDPSNAAESAEPDDGVAPGVDVTIEVIEEGDGEVLTKDGVGLVEYTGYLQTGREFDSSRKPGREPFRVTMNPPNVVEGWIRGLEGMRVGGKRKLVIPPELAYGDKRSGNIPANSTLVFYVELVGVE
jgi:hypothetical protein